MRSFEACVRTETVLCSGFDYRSPSRAKPSTQPIHVILLFLFILKNRQHHQPMSLMRFSQSRSADLKITFSLMLSIFADVDSADSGGM